MLNLPNTIHHVLWSSPIFLRVVRRRGDTTLAPSRRRTLDRPLPLVDHYRSAARAGNEPSTWTSGNPMAHGPDCKLFGAGGRLLTASGLSSAFISFQVVATVFSTGILSRNATFTDQICWAGTIFLLHACLPYPDFQRRIFLSQLLALSVASSRRNVKALEFRSFCTPFRSCAKQAHW